MATQNPLLKRPGQTAAAGIPAIGGMPQTPNPISAMTRAATGTTMLKPGQAAPDVNPLPLGTRVGSGIASLRKTVGNTQADMLNAGARAGAGALNVLSYPGRALGGFVRDVGRAVVGAPASPNAGNPVGGFTAPQLQHPFQPTPVDFLHPPGDPAESAAAAPPGAAPAAAVQPAAASAPTAANLAMAKRLGLDQVLPDTQVTAPTLQAPVVDSGTTLRRPDGSTAKLNYGAMVDGVPTFSDGTGGIQRTMSDATLKRLATAPSISRADVGALGTALASDALGGTPTQEQMVQQRLNTLRSTQPITGSRPSAEQFAASDLAAIASGDPRSALGTAASNLRSEAAYATSPALRKMAVGQLQALTGGVATLGQQQVQGDQAQALGAQRGDQAMALEGQRGADQLANTALMAKTAALRRPQQQVTLANGTIGLLDPVTGLVTPSKQADGSPAKALVSRDDSQTKRVNQVMDSIAAGTQALMKNFLPTKDQPTPTPQMIAGWREQAARAQGLRLGTDPKTGRRVVEVDGQVLPL